MAASRGNGEASGDVYEHLGRIVDRVITDKPQDAYSLFEVISRMIKESSDTGATGEEEAIAAADSAAASACVDYVKLLKQLDAVPKEEDAEKELCAVPDCMEDGDLLSWAGVGLGALEFYKVACSLRALAAKEKADAGMEKVRFWGKILGTGADYYVAEAKVAPGDVDAEAEDAAITEEPGKGVNMYAYYVTTDPADVNKPWRKLPDLRPRHITSARQVKKLATGNLSAKVITHPNYPGDEGVLLRAQIARITADTTICPKGFLKRPEEDPEGDPAEDLENFVCPLPAEMLKKPNWMHMSPHILRNGRTTYVEIDTLIPEDEENQEVTAQRAKYLAEMEADPKRDEIRDLEGDDLEWTIKQSGDDALYESPPKADEEGNLVPQPPTCNAVTYVRSLKWPGAVTVLRGGRFVNFYVGYGLPAGEPDFFFPAPLDIQDEPPDADEQVEPQGPEPEAAAPEDGGD